MSPSTRGCGLKSIRRAIWRRNCTSPSTRGCGLKSTNSSQVIHASMVTLYTRVWIEIRTEQSRLTTFTVTLYTRVWIEIFLIFPFYPSCKTSPSTRGCGLKSLYVDSEEYGGLSPSTRGCGLKSKLSQNYHKGTLAPSTRGCGLKCDITTSVKVCKSSPSTRGCGLKYKTIT